MKHLVKAFAVLAALALMTVGVTGPVAAKPGNGSGTVAGSAYDANALALGEIRYLFNNAGYHFWFTATGDVGVYEEGDSYHNVYKYAVDDPDNWCGGPGTPTVPDRAPYNAGGTVGATVYYKIWNVTDGMYVCGSESVNDSAL